MSTGNIFYSEIDRNLQAELNARGKAGIYNRTDRSMAYMLEKVANVEVIAMVDQKHVDSKNPDNEKNILHRLGGAAVRSGEYLPTGANGFLKDRVTQITNPLLPGGSATEINSSYRIPPFITSAEMQLNDHSMGLLNSATVNIIIPNPDRDLDFMESVYARPGRAISLLIEHPDSAVITEKKLMVSTLQPAIVGATAQKMNNVSFNGLIKSFTYSYLPDGTVSMTIYLIGTSNVYTDVSMYVYEPDQPSANIIKTNVSPVTKINPPKSQTENSAEKEAPASFYKQIYNEVDSYYQKQTKPDTEVKTAYLHSSAKYDATIGNYESNDRMACVVYDWNKKEQRYITLAYLISFLNRYIISKQHAIAPNALIICSDEYCYSNYLPTVLSANPIDIWLSGGTHDKYGSETADREAKLSGTTTKSKKWYDFKDANVISTINFSENKKSYPSRIYINLNVIDRILVDLLKSPDDFKATNFLTEISKLISASTGNFINMKLISYPDNPDYLIYYDANFKGAGSYNIKPYSVPMFANHPSGTIVRDFKFESKLPQNMQSLMYTINQSDTISEEKIAPFLNYMYNNRVTTRTTDKKTGILSEVISSGIDNKVKLELDAKYTAAHIKYKTALGAAALKFASDGLTNKTTQTELSNALIKHIQWPTDKIDKSAHMTAAVYPMEVSFTIDGINGLRYGDTVEFNALPAKYKNNTTFSIIGITHTVSTNGEWITNINCIMRPKFD
jgi:hypothetical protein